MANIITNDFLRSLASSLPRVLTVVAVVAPAVIACRMGLELTRFSLAVQTEGPPSRLRAWTTQPGVALLAHGAILEQTMKAADKSAELAARLAAAGDLLARAPLNARAWATAGELCLAAKGPLVKCLQALNMSNLTGPNEGPLMAARAVLELPLWDRLPQRSRRFAAIDLAGGWESVLQQERVALREFMSRADDATRAGLLTELLRAADGAPVATALGLALGADDPSGSTGNEKGR